ncbi:peptidase S1 and S6 chymotrypsin/Hap family protein [Nitzschia inconspicua]|uniref:Peptidase S1 and S6 chymotrypsin/Hap family protein n=1 Tax=Nitzschia inconspicua TaxID=303405 RepID=A0A9K3Q7W5_9STRA|nr:peptidase S1 and S6 chymotrypsin/Hap family protein [Nitzschia inconspicua]
MRSCIDDGQDHASSHVERTVNRIIKFLPFLVTSALERSGVSSAAGGTMEHIPRHLRQNNPNIQDGESFSPRIINGRKVDNASERFPYFVTLRNDLDQHICGGTLIAPDIVLTAAHCNFDDMTVASIGGSQDFSIPIMDLLPNPLFIRDELSYDQMVVKLAWAAFDELTNQTVPTVKINLDENFPDFLVNHTQDDDEFYVDELDDDEYYDDDTVEISIIGFGQTYSSNVVMNIPNITYPSMPTTLQLTQVDFVPNNRCRNFTQDDVDYSQLITDDMICGKRKNTGQCHGDSGGPYLFLQSGEEDIQVGIVSFGIGCANPNFPSVGSRTSATQWIRQATCLHSDFAPTYFDCDQFESDAPSVAPSTPTISPQPTVQQIPLTLTIRFDMFPEETGWEIWDVTETILYGSRPAGWYNASHLDSVATETILVHHGQNYTLLITDSNKNGMSRWGILIELKAVIEHQQQDEDEDEEELHRSTSTITLVQGTGKFSERARHSFFVPYEDEQAIVVPPESTTEMWDYTTTVYLNMTFDSWPSETGWSIVHAQNHSEVFAEAVAGTYLAGKHIMETIEIPILLDDDVDGNSTDLYALIVTDLFGDGILEGGGYVLWMNTEYEEEMIYDGRLDNSTRFVLAEGHGNEFQSIAVHNFSIWE